MANIVTQNNQNNNKSPFDSIRQVKENGAEFWMARELMPLLGYQRWDRVPDVIDRASVSCQNAGNPVSEHFSEVTRKTSGRPQQDFELSRYASYLVAMNGDPRKPEIACAQSYFAVKTHQAESAAQSAQAPFQLPQTYLEALKALVATEEERQRLEAKVEEDAPLVSYASAVQASETALDMNEYAKSINWGRNRLFRVLRELGVIMQTSTLPYQRWLDAGYFEVSQEIITGTGKLVPFALVTGKGQIWLKQKIDTFLAQEKRQQEAFGAMLMNSVFPTA